MARASLTAAQLHAKYAQLLSQPPFSDATSAYHLHKALTGRQPPIAVSEAAVNAALNTLMDDQGVYVSVFLTQG